VTLTPSREIESPSLDTLITSRCSSGRSRMHQRPATARRLLSRQEESSKTLRRSRRQALTGDRPNFRDATNLHGATNPTAALYQCTARRCDRDTAESSQLDANSMTSWLPGSMSHSKITVLLSGAGTHSRKRQVNFTSLLSILRRIGIAGACVLVLSSCSDRSDPLQPIRIEGSRQASQTQPDVYEPWESCTSWDGGATFSCLDEGFVSYLFYYDYGSEIVQVSQVNCEISTCAGGANFAGLQPAHENDLIDLGVGAIDCNVTQTEPGRRAFCKGFVPSGSRLTRIQAALNKMRAINATCAGLAAIGDALLARGDLRVFAHSDSLKGGYAPLGGGSSGPHSFIAIENSWTDVFFDDSHHTNESIHRNLQQVLAHGLDHLNGETHTNSPSETPHSESCSLVP
jgi:hypothetical protein